MEWYSFKNKYPLVGEKILVLHEWLDYDFKLHQDKKSYAIYECNFTSIKKNKHIVRLVNLKQIAGEKAFNFLQSQYFSVRALHWARLG